MCARTATSGTGRRTTNTARAWTSTSGRKNDTAHTVTTSAPRTGPTTTGRARGVRPLRLDDLDGLARFDATYFGANRRPLLDLLAEEVPSTFLVAESRGSIRGFLAGNPGGDTCEIGPWVVAPESGPVAGHLYRGLVAAARTAGVAVVRHSLN